MLHPLNLSNSVGNKAALLKLNEKFKMKRRTSLIIQMHEGYDWEGAVADTVDLKGWDWYLVSVEVVREV